MKTRNLRVTKVVRVVFRINLNDIEGPGQSVCRMWAKIIHNTDQILSGLSFLPTSPPPCHSSLHLDNVVLPRPSYHSFPRSHSPRFCPQSRFNLVNIAFYLLHLSPRSTTTTNRSGRKTISSISSHRGALSLFSEFINNTVIRLPRMPILSSTEQHRVHDRQLPLLPGWKTAADCTVNEPPEGRLSKIFLPLREQIELWPWKIQRTKKKKA